MGIARKCDNGNDKRHVISRHFTRLMGWIENALKKSPVCSS
jgi:hypothetical protein